MPGTAVLDLTPEGFRKRLVTLRDECQQLVNDAHHWNEINPVEVPFDTGADLVAVRMADEGIAAIDAGEMVAAARIIHQLTAHVTLAANQDQER